jgi:hypothetical protein
MQGQCQTGPRIKIHVSDLFIRSCVQHVPGYSAGDHEKPVVLTQKVVDFNHFRKARFWKAFYLLENLMLKIGISDSASNMALSRYNFNYGRRSN